MALDGDEIGGGGSKLALIVYYIPTSCLSYTFCFFFLGAIGANDARRTLNFCVLVFRDVE